MKLPRNELIQYPTGLWGFVGRVDACLAFVNEDGSPPTDQQIERAQQFGERFGHFKHRTFATKAEARDARFAAER